MAKYTSYVICTSPRSGSTLLCQLLAATGVAGKPGSYFHDGSISAWLGYYDLTPDEAASEREVLAKIFAAAIAEGSAGTGVFGLRLQRHSFDFFSRKLEVLHPDHSSERERFQAAFGRTAFIHLTRTDKIEQAVSYVKAQQTGLWHAAPDGTELERLSTPQSPAYAPDKIAANVEEMTAYDRQWENWFKAEGLTPLLLTYAELSADPVNTLKRVLDHLGLDRDAAHGVEPGVAKLADEMSKSWVARFRSERGAL
ncbi:MAG: sulfotransferase [Alphaproteobacteria bacterium]|nr:sulfotransferase [Alphaproteobacteria bacterium]